MVGTRQLPRRLRHGEDATLVEHLEELRARLFVVLIASAITSALAFAFHSHILDWLNHPLPAGKRHPVTFGVAEPFTVSLTVSIWAGFLLALPIILWQFWGFFAPAVHPRFERKALELVAVATALGLAGLAFGYLILLPRAIHFLTNYDERNFTHLIQARPYYSFVTTILVGVVARTHGNRGEVIVNAETDFPEERFREGAQLMTRRKDGSINMEEIGGPPEEPPPPDGPPRDWVGTIRKWYERIQKVREKLPDRSKEPEKERGAVVDYSRRATYPFEGKLHIGANRAIKSYGYGFWRINTKYNCDDSF